MNTHNPYNQAAILIVDDNPVNLRVMIQHLADSGFETRIAQSGEDALEQLDIALPDLILLDIMMPGLDGFDTCQQIKQNPKTKDIPIIFMTALSETCNKVKGFRLGAVDYITKPFQQEEVLARINTHLTIQYQKLELARLNATKDRFFSIIAHDLRGVFNPIIISTDVLVRIAQKEAQETMIQFAEGVQRSTRNAYQLLENLLTWSRVQRGVMAYTPQKIVLNYIISRNISLYSEKAIQKNIQLTGGADSQLIGYADDNMIDTVIRNLIYNALKFTRPEGTIDVSAYQEEQTIIVKVVDNGIGIEKQDQDRLFKIDTKFKTKGTANEEGTGLGLILCKELVEINKGTIQVESELDKGSTFQFTLPAA